MSLLLRAKSSAGKRLFANALQHLHLYSTKSADAAPKPPKSTKLKSKSQKSSESSPGSIQRVMNQMTAPSTALLKPKEIPYQAKVANSVNLVGFVEAPVRSETAFDGKHLAAIVISQQYSDGKECFSVPVVFDGDLASVVAHHVKQNDCVLVSGRLSEEPMKFSLGDKFGNFHVVAEDLNFVEGLSRKVSSDVKVENSDPEKIELYEKEDNVHQPDRQFVKNGSASGDSVESSGNALELKPEPGGGWSGNVARKEKGVATWRDALKLDQQFAMNNSLSGNSVETSSNTLESKPAPGNSWSGNMSRKEKEEAMWRDLVKNPLLWWDFRQHKLNGLVKDKYPDFKHKWNDDPLWLGSVPQWVLPELGKLEFDVKVMQGKQVQSGQGSGDRHGGNNKLEDLWKNFVEKPTEWWDNRLNKRNPKSPDFKHKATGEGLWSDTLPEWASSSLPELGKLEGMQGKQVQSGQGFGDRQGGNNKLEDLWKNFVEKPTEWRDNRLNKWNPKSPDFKHQTTGEGLWSDTLPEWASSSLPELGKLEVMQGKQVQSGQGSGDIQGGNNKLEDLWKNCVEKPTEWWDNRLNKRNPKSPDFKHKTTGEGLWLNTLPEWASSKLLPSKDTQNAGQANPQAF